MCEPKSVPIPPEERSPELLKELCGLWEASVRASHFFLTDSQIAELRPFVRTGLQTIESLEVLKVDGGAAGFMGIENRKLEVLFLAPQFFKRGFGSRLMRTALEKFGIQAVDVNEQNPAALRFYLRSGFEIAGRSPLDGQGNPFPILHLKLKPEEREPHTGY